MTANDDSQQPARIAAGEDLSPAEAPAQEPLQTPAARKAPSRWRWLTPLVCVLCGAMFPISAANSGGSDLRPGRYTDLGALADAQRREGERLTERAAQLNNEISRLSGDIQDAGVRAARRRAEALEAPAGLRTVRGEGVRITLSDSPAEVRAVSSADPRWMVVHQQDIQAVVNALWQGGAQAVTIQGQRVVSSTGIRCEGSLVLLQGQPYAQPYVIEAVGDPFLLQGAIDEDSLINYYRQQALDPDVQIGWGFDFVAEIEAPPFQGVLSNTYARPIRGSASY
jgi:uncharacterized protein YlxW (UPF0749 family)